MVLMLIFFPAVVTSSISNSNHKKIDWKVLLSVVAMLAMLAASLRVGEPWLSQDIRRMQQIPAIVQGLAT
jgi:hypothetical protein